MFLSLQLASLAFRKCLYLATVRSLAKLRDNCETKQKIEFSVKYLTVFRILHS